MKKKTKTNFVCFWLSPLLSVVYQWVLRSQAHTFWAPLVYVWGINSLYGWSTMSPWTCVDGETFGLMQGDSGVPDSFTQVPLFCFSEEVQKEEWAAVAKSYGGLHLNSPERRHSVYWRASRKATLRTAAVRTPGVRSWTLTQTIISKEGRCWLRKQGRTQWWSLESKADPPNLSVRWAAGRTQG